MRVVAYKELLVTLKLRNNFLKNRFKLFFSRKVYNFINIFKKRCFSRGIRLGSLELFYSCPSIVTEESYRKIVNERLYFELRQVRVIM